MHRLEGKKCPFYNKECLLTGCAFFSERLENCEFSVLNFNLYQHKEHLRALIDAMRGVPEGIPASDLPDQGKGPNFPRPGR